MIEYKPYEKTEGAGKFLKIKELIPNEGDEVRFKCVTANIVDGYKGKPQLNIEVVWQNTDGKGEKKVLSVDAPSEENKMAGSQIYRGMVDNNIQENDVFVIVNGGKMKNEYHTTIYNVQKETVSDEPAPTTELTVEEVKETMNEDVNMSDIPF